MSKSILCAIDVSEPNAEMSTLNKAAQLAEMEGATLDVVTVVPDFGMSVVSEFFDGHHHEKMINQTKEKLRACIIESLGKEADSKIRHIVAVGNVYEQILKTAKSADSDTIVIGAHKPDFKDYLLGPNAARVVRHSMRSVFVVRD